MYLNKDIIRPYVTALKGDAIEVISCKGRPAILVQCNGVKFSVNENDIVDVRPCPGDIPIKKDEVSRITPVRMSFNKSKPIKKLTASQKSLY